MATKKKMLQAASGSAGGAGLDIDEVFSTYLYTGTEASTQTITNGIDLAGEGGLVWAKARDDAINHVLMDSEQGVGKFLNSNQTYAQQTNSEGMKSFNSNGFTFGTQTGVGWSNDHVYWTFRKAPKFFDVVTYTGNGVAGRTISHDLGAVPGFMVVKKTSGTGVWYARHRHDYDDYYRLNDTDAASSYANLWASYDPTDVDFKVGTNDLNNSGDTYVAYLFAHNNGDGEFGPSGSDIIKCGSFSVNGSYEADVDIGFEPQWLMIKPAEDVASWMIFDTMRGAAVNGDTAWLAPDLSQQEANTANRFWPTPTGFHIGNYGITAGNDIIYMAIRRGPLNRPTAGTEVFVPAVQGVSGANPTYPTGIVTDFSITTAPSQTSDKKVMTRLLGATELVASDTSVEGSYGNAVWDYMNGWGNEANQTDKYSWAWKRAPSYFDVVAYTGIGGNRTLSHNLDAAPEMMWVKSRGNSEDWYVYHKDLGNGSILILNTTSSVFNGMSNVWNNTSPTSSVFTVGPNGKVNLSGDTFIAYLFATLAGISKVGSVTHSGTTNVDCGFSSGARFVMLKRTDATGDWYIWDSVRGIIAGDDPYLLLNSTAAQEINTDYIDPLSSGFTITSNFTAGDYIFYAIS